MGQERFPQVVTWRSLRSLLTLPGDGHEWCLPTLVPGRVRPLSLLLGRIGRWSGGEIARSAFSLARSAQAERDNELWFFSGSLTQKRCIDLLTSTFGYETPSKTTVHRWFSSLDHSRLDSSNRDESWICAYDLETKQQSTVWVFQYEPNPTKRHTSAETTRFLEGQKIKDRIDGLSAIQPRFGTNDFYLFPSVKDKLRGPFIEPRRSR
ncbi:hypothetical protein EVAR_49001_1 [Eumeta japonica]|uniref:Mos1 transposase HTH domain-containing protein n=1 Tax=Eumeta variegata TaxID=151549 RepID=A0A4C1Z073_EUMVA|nr:hypothetical protein EVAR_49001_1 [Eumeta japonica]